MNFKEIQELVKLVTRLELAEFKIKDGEFQLHIRSKHYMAPPAGNGSNVITTPTAPILSVPQVAPAYVPAAPQPGAGAAPAPPRPAAEAPAGGGGNNAPEANKNYVTIKSPMVGTFYRSSSPEKPAYVKVGDTVAAGDTVCIVEAMKLFNEIESEVSGVIVKVMVEDAQPVEYDQVLFLVDPKG